MYIKLGSPPTRGDYDYRSSQQAAADQELSVSLAAPGTWYILVYGYYVPLAADYTLTVAAAPLLLTQMTPIRHGDGADAAITIKGAGFDATSTVRLVSGSRTYTADDVSLDSFTQITAMFAPVAFPWGGTRVRVARADGTSSDMPGTFEVTSGNQPKLEANLILPDALGFHQLGTIYLEYSNTGDVAMPAPLLVLTVTQNGREGAILTLDQSRLQDGFWTSAMPDGFSHSIQVLAGGEVPGLLEPGETCRVPVYWAGWQKPWDTGAPFEFQMGVLDADNTSPIDWAALRDQASLPGVQADAWKAVGQPGCPGWHDLGRLVEGDRPECHLPWAAGRTSRGRRAVVCLRGAAG